MLEIQKYLQNKTIDDLYNNFTIKHHRHSKYNNLILFKYHMINSPMNKKIVQECRGIILDENNNWNIISRSFDKFFNYSEKNAAKLDLSKLYFYEKLDGSIMTMYFYDNKWMVQTSGKPDACGIVNNHKFTFKDLFWKTFNEMKLELPRIKNICYIFELTSEYNRIIVKYSKPRLTLIGCRDIVTQEEHFVDYFMHDYPIPKIYEIKDITEAIRSFNNISGFDLEGYVVMDKYFNRIKLKSKDYLRLFRTRNNSSDSFLLDIIRNEGIDKYLKEFNEYEKEINILNNKFIKLKNNLKIKYEKCKNIKEQKQFAISIKDTQLNGILFNLRYGKLNTIEDGLKIINLKKLLNIINS